MTSQRTYSGLAGNSNLYQNYKKIQLTRKEVLADANVRILATVMLTRKMLCGEHQVDNHDREHNQKRHFDDEKEDHRYALHIRRPRGQPVLIHVRVDGLSFIVLFIHRRLLAPSFTDGR